MAKKVLTEAQVKRVLEKVSNKSKNLSGKEMPGYVMGYLMSMLMTYAEMSPAVRKDLISMAENTD